MRRTLQSGGCAGAGEMALPRELGQEAGSTLVEFAFVFMLLMTMMLGIVEFGRALYAYHFTSGAARQASRWAAVNGAKCGAPPLGDNSCDGIGGMNSGPASSTDIQNYVKELATSASLDTSGSGCGGSACLTTTASWPVNADSPDVCSTAVTGITGSPYPNYPGCTVKVQVSYDFNFLVPFVHRGSLAISSTSQMIIAH